jgi:hypothetical protein
LHIFSGVYCTFPLTKQHQASSLFHQAPSCPNLKMRRANVSILFAVLYSKYILHLHLSIFCREIYQASFGTFPSHHIVGNTILQPNKVHSPLHPDYAASGFGIVSTSNRCTLHPDYAASGFGLVSASNRCTCIFGSGKFVK